jgi:predicted transposase YdaD
MKTDKHFFKLFTIAPWLAYELLGEKPPPSCTGDSVLIKEIEQEIDLLITPSDNRPRIVFEPQFYLDKTIYARTAFKMSWLQIRHEMCPVRGIILFGLPQHDPKTEPWTHSVESVQLGTLLEELEKRDPDHALLGLMKPLLVKKSETLVKMVPECYNKIQNSPLDATLKELLTELFLDWLRLRFETKSKAEIEAMFGWTTQDLAATRSGKDLIAIGEARGETKGKAKGKAEGKLEGKAESVVQFLKARFKSISKKLEQRILAVTDQEVLSDLVIKAATCPSLKEFDF